MKAKVGCCLVSLAFAVACGSRPDTALFGSVTSTPIEGAVGGSGPVSAGGSFLLGGGASTAGGSPRGGSSNGAAPGVGGLTSDGGTGEAPGASGTAGSGGSGIGGNPAQPKCGNGVLEEGEECDDEEHAGEDGCGADCQVICGHFGEEAVKSEDHHCYNGYDSADFEGAQQDCVSRGGHLATLAGNAENALARSLVRNSKWIGAREAVSAMDSGSGAYQWINGEPFSFTNWATNEPDRASSRCSPFNENPRCYEHCAVMLEDGTWEDRRCDIEDGYVCEWDPAGL